MEQSNTSNEMSQIKNVTLTSVLVYNIIAKFNFWSQHNNNKVISIINRLLLKEIKIDDNFVLWSKVFQYTFYIQLQRNIFSVLSKPGFFKLSSWRPKFRHQNLARPKHNTQSAKWFCWGFFIILFLFWGSWKGPRPKVKAIVTQVWVATHSLKTSGLSNKILLW